MQSSSVVRVGCPVQENGGPPQGLKVELTGRDMFLWPIISASSVSRTRGLLYWVRLLWQRRHWSPAPAAPVVALSLTRRPPGPYAGSVREGITQLAVQVPAVTHVP